MTVAEMIDEIIRVVSKKEEEKFEGILDTASLKDLNNHYDQMSSSVSESKVPLKPASPFDSYSVHTGEIKI